MPPKVIRIVNGEIREVDEEPPPQQPRRTVVNGQASDSEDDDGPRSSEDVIAQRLFGASSASNRSGPTFDFTKPPLSVAWEDRASSLAGLPGLSVFGAHLSSRWLVALAVTTAVAGLKGLLISFAVWVLFKLGFEGGENGATGPGGHRLGAHPHSGALPARALASYLAAAGAGRASAAAGTTQATTTAAGGAGGGGVGTVGGSAGAASSSAAAKKSSEDVRDATRKAWAAREAAVAAAAKAAADESEG